MNTTIEAKPLWARRFQFVAEAPARFLFWLGRRLKAGLLEICAALADLGKFLITAMVVTVLDLGRLTRGTVYCIVQGWRSEPVRSFRSNLGATTGSAVGLVLEGMMRGVSYTLGAVFVLKSMGYIP